MEKELKKQERDEKRQERLRKLSEINMNNINEIIKNLDYNYYSSINKAIDEVNLNHNYTAKEEKITLLNKKRKFIY